MRAWSGPASAIRSALAVLVFGCFATAPRVARAQTRGPTIRIASVSATGALPRDVIRRVFDRNRSQLLYCYSDAVHDTPGAAGVLVVAVNILPSGRVGRVTASGSGRVRPSLRRCAENVVSRWEFPIYSPPAGARASVRIRLVPDDILDRRQ